MSRPGSSAAAAAALMLALAAPPARAQPGPGDAAAAEALFREGRALAAEGRHEEACPRFEASQKLDPGYGTLWNLATCLERIGRTASAWAAFREAADMARKAAEEDRVEKAERRAAALEPKLHRLRVVVPAPPPGLEVRRGGALLPEGSWGQALPVDPGRIRIDAKAPGRQPFSVEVEAADEGETATVEIPALAEAAATDAPRRDAPPVAARGGGAQRVLAYTAGGIGLAGVAVGAVFGLRAGAVWSEAQEQHCRTDTLCDEEGVALAAEADTAAVISNVAFAVGGVGLAAGVLLLVTAPGEDPPKAARIMIAPAVGTTGGGVTLQGRF